MLVPKHILITQGSEAHTHRHLRATIPWTRNQLLHGFNVYVRGVSYHDRDNLNGAIFDQVQQALTTLGRVPWLLGADFSQEPKEALLSWRKRATRAAPEVPTHFHGRTLDRFMLSPLLGVNCTTQIVEDAEM